MFAPSALLAAQPWVRWEWVADHKDVIADRLWQHVELTAIAVVVGVAISLPLGVACHRFQRLYGPVVVVTGIIYGIPSLALLVLLIPYTGLTTTTAAIALVSYTLLVLVRNVVTGLDAVPPYVKEAADGMGYGRMRRLATVELPLALPPVIAGIRIASVTTVGLVTIAALIGQGGLGQLILDGLRRDFRTPLVVGTVLAIALATLIDVSLAGIQRRLMPWARGR